MKLNDWMSRAIPGETWARMERTMPGAMAKALDTILYNFSDDHSQKYRGVVLTLSNGEHTYVGYRDEWPRWDGKGEGKDVAYIDVRKTLRELQHLLEAYAFAEANGGNGKRHVCEHCQKAAP
jgi:hypothetical protein